MDGFGGAFADPVEIGRNGGVDVEEGQDCDGVGAPRDAAAILAAETPPPSRTRRKKVRRSPEFAD